MKRADWPAIQRLLSENPAAGQWSALPQASVLVAEQQGKIVGMVAFRVTADEAEVLNIAVAEAQKRRGCGSGLLEAAMAQAAGAGACRAFLEVRESNFAARLFYRRMHFSEASRRRNYYRQPDEDALIFVRKLR